MHAKEARSNEPQSSDAQELRGGIPRPGPVEPGLFPVPSPAVRWSVKAQPQGTGAAQHAAAAVLAGCGEATRVGARHPLHALYPRGRRTRAGVAAEVAMMW